MAEVDHELEQFKNLRRTLRAYEVAFEEHLHTVPNLDMFSYNTSFQPSLNKGETVGDKRSSLLHTLKTELDDDYKERVSVNVDHKTSELTVCYRIKIEPTEENAELIKEKTGLAVCKHGALSKPMGPPDEGPPHPEA